MRFSSHVGLTLAWLAIGPARVVEGEAPGTATEVVDGAATPDRIPHPVAYRLLFRSLASPSASGAPQNSPEADEAVRRAHRLQILQMLSFAADEGTVLLTVADEYVRRVQELDRRAEELKDLAWPDPSPEAALELTELQQRRDRLVRELIRSLPRRLGADAFAKLDRYVTEEVKKRIVMTPGPTEPPAQRIHEK